MQTVSTKTELYKIIEGWKTDNLKIGFVPTMGALHEGHLSLVKIALENADKVVVSIFVNPTQFAPHEDFESYPRDIKTDLKKLETEGTDLIYLPNEEEIYPNGKETSIKPGPAAEGLETDFRPHFFGGVVNVVARLFDQVQPDTAVFGEKDYQQLCVIREMVEIQNLAVEIIGGPIIRDEEGLALASRNQYLSDEELSIAQQLNKILRQTKDPQEAKEKLLATGFDKIDYVESRWSRLLAAAWVGKTRLIDNIGI